MRAVCISEQKGTKKHPVERAVLVKEHGIVGDAHSGTWHRQVSLLSYEKVKEFESNGIQIQAGDFGENLLVEDFNRDEIMVGMRLKCGQIMLEVTQIGKTCHTHCAIHQQVGACIMPKEGIFAKVLSGGVIHPGDELRLLPMDPNRCLQAAVMTLSDQGARGLRIDESGPLIVSKLTLAGYEVVERCLYPDDQKVIEAQLKRLCDSRQVQLLVTTGGTGFSPRDCTPEATLKVATRNVPGIAEVMRIETLKFTRRSMLSRGVSVIRNNTLIVNLPGSPKAVEECLDVILPELEHGIRILCGLTKECADKSLL